VALETDSGERLLALRPDGEPIVPSYDDRCAICRSYVVYVGSYKTRFSQFYYCTCTVDCPQGGVVVCI
jgi:hypothetical protein